jgi:superfamily II DNA or RNA helicase
MNLYPHQQHIVDTAPNKYGLFLKMRVGKTATAIRLASTRASSAIVIVPKSLKEQWEEEIHNWNNSKTIFYVITKETFRKKWKEVPKFEACIIDECHIGFANFKSQLYKSAESYCKKHKSTYIWLLTGTPYTSSSWSIYSLGKLLGKDWKWFDWKRHFFFEVAMGPRTIPVQKKGIEEEISKIINKIGVTMSLSDISQQAHDEYVKEYFDLNKEQEDAIKEAFDPLPIVRFTKYHQIEQGTLKGDGYTEDKKFNCSKGQRLLEIISENHKIAIVCRYNLQLVDYKELIEKEGRKVFIINGETKDKNEVIKGIDTCDDCVVLINSACSAGYSLASIDTMVFASMDFSFVNNAQVKDRIKNMAKNQSCTYIYLLTRSIKGYKSVDQGVYDAVENKTNFDACIFGNK